MAPTPPRDVLAAGVVAFRPGRQVLLVHRPRYDDWSFPKGKLDRGERLPAAAVREAWEETGLHVRLGPPLSQQRYPLSGNRRKRVSYWTARCVGTDDVGGYVPNAEIDQVVWVDADKAEAMLTYPHDRETLAEGLRRRRRTQPLVVLRHGKARSRKAWRGEDRGRPLITPGREQAQALVPLLAAYGVERVVTSSSTRCVETVTPYADTTGWTLVSDDRLTEEDHSAKRVARLLEGLRTDLRPTVVCTHRPVLPEVFEALGVPDPGLDVGAMLVVHLRKDAVVATEVHGSRG